jgi:hypothetical protein
MHAFSRSTINYILSCIRTAVYTIMYKVTLRDVPYGGICSFLKVMVI